MLLMSFFGLLMLLHLKIPILVNIATCANDVLVQVIFKFHGVAPMTDSVVCVICVTHLSAMFYIVR